MHSRKAAWVQGAALAAVIVAIASAVVFRFNRPLDRDALAIQVAQLQSNAAEAQWLVDNAHADRLAPGVVRQHAQQMAAMVETSSDTLKKLAQPELKAQKMQAQRLGASLHRGLVLLGRGGAAHAELGFDATADALGALHEQLKTAD